MLSRTKEMEWMRNQLIRFLTKSRLISVYWFLQGLPPISPSKIEFELIKACIGKPDPTIVEIGCNDGMHTLEFLRVFENPTVYCFEPEPRAMAKFKRHVGQHPNVQLFELAVSDCAGHATFYQSSGHPPGDEARSHPEGWDYSGSIREPHEHRVMHPWITFENTITVETTTLDSWRKRHEIGTIDFIWMDVQGAEGDVFRGAREALRSTRFIHTEYSNRELYRGQMNLKQLMRELGHFEIVCRDQTDVLLRNTAFCSHDEAPS